MLMPLDDKDKLDPVSDEFHVDVNLFEGGGNWKLDAMNYSGIEVY